MLQQILHLPARSRCYFFVGFLSTFLSQLSHTHTRSFPIRFSPCKCFIFHSKDVWVWIGCWFGLRCWLLTVGNDFKLNVDDDDDRERYIIERERVREKKGERYEERSRGRARERDSEDMIEWKKPVRSTVSQRSWYSSSFARCSEVATGCLLFVHMYSIFRDMRKYVNKNKMLTTRPHQSVIKHQHCLGNTLTHSYTLTLV